MARMHTRKRGKSGSRNTYYGIGHDWVEMSPEEIEEMVVQFRKEGLTASQIGIRFRDSYGIPKLRYITHKKIGDVLSEKNMNPDVPEDLMALITKYKRVTKHMELNKNDLNNGRKRNLLMAKMLRLVRYYKENGYLSKEWELNKVL